MFRRQGQFKHRGIQPENLGQHLGCIPGRQFPAVGSPFVGGQVFTLFQGHGHRVVRVRIHEQVVFRQKPGKQHAVPVLVCYLFHEAVHGLVFTAVQGIPQLAAVNPQAPAQNPLWFGQMGIGGRLAHAQLIQGGGCGMFGNAAGIFDGFFQGVAERFIQRIHERFIAFF